MVKNNNPIFTIEIPSTVNEYNSTFLIKYLREKRTKGCSFRTLYNYRKYLLYFFNECPLDIPNITEEYVFSWYQQKYEHCKERSQRTVLQNLANFFEFLVNRDLIAESPVDRDWIPNIPEELPPNLSREKIARINIVVEQKPLIDRAIYEMLRTSALRNFELRPLTVADLDLENCTGKIIGKGGKERVFSYSLECRILLERLIKDLRLASDDYLFSKNNYQNKDRNKDDDRPYSATKIRTVIHQLGEEAKLDVSLYPHLLRHIYACKMSDEGVPLHVIQKALGHANIETTKIYANITKEVIKEAYFKYR